MVCVCPCPSCNLAGLAATGGLIVQCLSPEAKETLGRPLNRFIEYHNNIQIIHRDIVTLESKKNQISAKVNSVREFKGETIKAEVKYWIEKVNETLDTFNKKVKGKVDGSRNCINSICGTPYEIGKMVDEIKELLSNAEGFQNEVSYLGGMSPAIAVYHIENKSLLSRVQISEMIMGYLKDGSQKVINIYGLPGAGKTHLLKMLVNRAGESKLFQVVTDITDISETPDVKKIQKSIAKRLNLYLDRSEGDDEEMSAETLREQLKEKILKKNRIFVVLDDVCTPLAEICAKIGIPYHTDKGEPSCTILMSSRKLHNPVENGSQFLLRLGCLPKVEALDWIKKEWRNPIQIEGGDTSVEDAILVKCDGLPLALLEMADILKNSDPNHHTFVHQLRNDNWSDIANVYNKTSLLQTSITRSYNLLKSEEYKKLFLLSCARLFQREETSISVDELMRYGIGLSLFGETETLKGFTYEADLWVKTLENLSLLETYKDSHGCISIHKIIQDVAISIASASGYLRLEDGFSPDVKYNIISTRVGSNENEGFRGTMFSELNALFLKGVTNGCEVNVYDAYFTMMKEVGILGLAQINLKTLPSSIECLQKLLTLSIEDCVIGDASLIRTLVNLKVLSLRRSKIEKYVGNGQLSNLILLDLTECCFGEVQGVVNNNPSKPLEGLYMYGCSSLAEGTSVEVVTEILVGRLADLENLYALEIRITNLLVDGDLLLTKKLQRFKVVVGGRVTSPFEEFYNFYNQVLSLEAIDANVLKRVYLQILMEKTECLRLANIENLQDVVPELGGTREPFMDRIKLKYFKYLKYLQISQCNKMKCIFAAAGLEPDSIIPELETLSLDQLNSLEVIYCGVGPQCWCSKLRQLKLSNLCNLKRHALLADHAHQLVGVEVKDCASLEYLFSVPVTQSSDGSMTVEIYKFPWLKKLELQNLPNLINCLQNSEPDQTAQLFHESIYLPDLEELNLLGLDKITKLWELPSSDSVDDLTIFSKLQMLKLEFMPSLNRVWEQRLSEESQSFKSLKKIDIVGCKNLESICPPTVAAALVELQSLKITSCPNLREVITAEDGANNVIKFSSMEKLELGDLQILQLFCRKSCTIEFPLLKDLRLYSLPGMLTFLETPADSDIAGSPTNVDAQGCSNSFIKIKRSSMDRLYLCGNNKNILEREEGDPPTIEPTTERLSLFDSFRGLTCTSISNLRDLHINGNLFGVKSIISCAAVVVGGMPQLEIINIEGCAHLEEIVSKECRQDITHGTLMFSNLKQVTLQRLANLKTFSSVMSRTTFPALEEVNINHCSIIESFTAGEICTPKLKTVRCPSEAHTCNEDTNLNDHIQKRKEDFRRGEEVPRQDEGFEGREEVPQLNRGFQIGEELPQQNEGFQERNEDFRRREGVPRQDEGFEGREEVPQPNEGFQRGEELPQQNEEFQERNENFRRREEVPRQDDGFKRREEVPQPNEGFQRGEELPQQNKGSEKGEDVTHQNEDFKGGEEAAQRNEGFEGDEEMQLQYEGGEDVPHQSEGLELFQPNERIERNGQLLLLSNEGDAEVPQQNEALEGGEEVPQQKEIFEGGENNKGFKSGEKVLQGNEGFEGMQLQYEGEDVSHQNEGLELCLTHQRVERDEQLSDGDEQVLQQYKDDARASPSYPLDPSHEGVTIRTQTREPHQLMTFDATIRTLVTIIAKEGGEDISPKKKAQVLDV